jgi:hypothetical protein
VRLGLERDEHAATLGETERAPSNVAAAFIAQGDYRSQASTAEMQTIAKKFAASAHASGGGGASVVRVRERVRVRVRVGLVAR